MRKIFALVLTLVWTGLVAILTTDMLSPETTVAVVLGFTILAMPMGYVIARLWDTPNDSTKKAAR